MKSLKHLTGAALLAAVLCSVASSQISAPDSKVAASGTGTIAGRVTLDGKPLSDVQLSLITAAPAHPPSRNTASMQAVADKDGKFLLTAVPAGVFTLTVAAGAYVVARDGYYGLPGKTIVVREGEELKGIDVSLKRGGVITGQVTDADGSPVMAQRMTLESLETGGTKRRIITGAPNDTDDRGIYRLYGLPDGRYLVSVRTAPDFAGSAGNSGYYPTVYYPGVVEESEAHVVEVGTAGAEIGDVNIVLNHGSELYTVSGRVVDSTTRQPLSNVRYTLAKDGKSTASPATPSTSRTNDHGEFLISNLTPGHYVIFAVPDSDSNAYSDTVPFVVTDRDLREMEIDVHQGSTLTGVVWVEGMDPSSSLETLTGLSVLAGQPDDTGRLNTLKGKVGQDGSFSISGLRPGKAFLLARYDPPKRLSLIRVEKDGQEQTSGIDVPSNALVSGVRLVVAYGNSTLRGEIKAQNGTLPEGTRFRIALMRTDVHGRIVCVSESDPQHRFVMTDLPIGDFELVVYAIPGNSSIPLRLAPVTKPVTVNSGSNDVLITMDLAPRL